MPGLGDEFRAAREARHLSLSDVSEQIHIRSVYLQSIEDEDWSAIAAPVYVRGFLRTYARFLGLEPEDAVARFNAAMGEAGARPEPTTVKYVGTRRSPSPWLWIAVAIAVVLVGFVGYRFYDQRANAPDGTTQAGASAAPASATPVAAASAAPTTVGLTSPGGVVATGAATPEAKLTRTLVVSITQTSWLLVSIDGAQIVEGIYPAGTIKKFHGKSASIRAGNAGGVQLTVNGKRMGPLGSLGSVVDKTIPLAEE